MWKTFERIQEIIWTRVIIYCQNMGYMPFVFSRPINSWIRSSLTERKIYLGRVSDGLHLLYSVGINQRVRIFTIPLFNRSSDRLPDCQITKTDFVIVNKSWRICPIMDIGIVVGQRIEQNESAKLHTHTRMRARSSARTYILMLTKKFSWVIGEEGVILEMQYSSNRIELC